MIATNKIMNGIERKILIIPFNTAKIGIFSSICPLRVTKSAKPRGNPSKTEKIKIDLPFVLSQLLLQ